MPDSALEKMGKPDTRRVIKDASYLVSGADLQQGRVRLLCVGDVRQKVKSAKHAGGPTATL
jgi:hypothetical protein